MKTIGIIGGITWLSTLDYYRLINQMVNKELGGTESAEIIMYSVNFAEIKELTDAGKWDEIAAKITTVAKTLELAGAQCIMIGANTMHKIADEVKLAVSIPIIHIAEETAAAIKTMGLKKVALLGTKYVMQQDFYKDKLIQKGITAIIPEDNGDILYINNAIYNEMGKGVFLTSTKEKFVDIINGLIARGVEGVVLGCTEIPILIKQEDCAVPVFDTTYIHAEAVVKFALSSKA